MSTRPPPIASWQLRMWSRKHNESRIDGGRGIGAASVTSSSATTAAGERTARSPAVRRPSAPRPTRSSNDTSGGIA
ncbi:Uncharacterised protein [Mycobacterium tuberculosis]|nr:Uncharacterised protein [Mycobacterium tuberculosis]